MKGKYKRKLIWCSHCDANIVEVGTKCKHCGHREIGLKVKKPRSNKILSEAGIK